MKRFMYILLSATALFIVLTVTPISAQVPPPPPSTGHGANGNQSPTGGTAPVEGGIGILMALAMAYGSRKALAARKETL